MTEQEYIEILRATLKGVLKLAKLEAERSPTWERAVAMIEDVLRDGGQRPIPVYSPCRD
jgi:hypothetical protein